MNLAEVTGISLPLLLPRPYQEEVYNWFNNGIKRAILCWHRRCGKDVTAFQVLIQQAFVKSAVYYYIFPTYSMGDKIIFSDQSKMSLLPRALVKNINNSDLKIEFLNGSTIQIIGSDRYDSMRGTNPYGVVFSEYGFQHPLAWETIRPILTENGGWALFESTPNGKNHFWELIEQAKENNNWKTSILPVNVTRSIPLEALLEEKKTMDPVMFAQEYLCSFDVGMMGAYYQEQMQWLEQNGRIGNFPHDPALPVETHWDLGISDATAIWFVQRLGGEVRLIDYYEATNKGFDQILTDIDFKG